MNPKGFVLPVFFVLRELVKKDTNFQFIELQIAGFDREFDGLAFGKFLDMHGREVNLEKGDAEQYVQNTLALIEAAKTESGELVGLPIDAKDHDKGDGAGWIVGISFDGERLRFIPKWTEIGRELISKSIRRFFSPTVDRVGKAVLGGSLTNWPASRDGRGKVLLRPIELSEGLFGVGGEDMSEPKDEIIEPEPTGDDTAAVEPATVDPQPLPAGNGELNMTVVDLSTLSDEQRAQLMEEAKKTVLADLSPDDGGTADEALERLRKELNLSAFADVADLSKAREALLSNAKLALESEYRRMQNSMGAMLADMMKGIKTEQHIAELSQQWTGGTDKYPHGFPVGREEVEAFLGSLNESQRKGAESILGRIHEQGLIEFSELGHGRTLRGTAELAKPYVALLDRWVKDGHPIDEFFAVNPELGDMASYDLSKYQESK